MIPKYTIYNSLSQLEMMLNKIYRHSEHSEESLTFLYRFFSRIIKHRDQNDSYLGWIVF